MPAHTADPVQDWPLLWFARLESAVERGDFAAAARAQRELERLGVSVQYRGCACKVFDGEPYYELEYSDTLLIFLLKGAKPRKYRESHRHEVMGKEGAAIRAEVKTEHDIADDLKPYATVFRTFVRSVLGVGGEEVPSDGAEQPVPAAQTPP